MVRKIISVIVGLISAIIIFVIVESLNSFLHPTPKGLNLNDANIVKEFFANQPISFWLLILFGWILGSLICGFLIAWLSKTDSKVLPIIAGVVLTLSAVANFILLPHPVWFIVVGLLVFIPIVLLGHKLKIKNEYE